LIANQIFDNALCAAGLMDDARNMLPRISQLLETASQSPGDIGDIPAFIPESEKSEK